MRLQVRVLALRRQELATKVTRLKVLVVFARNPVLYTLHVLTEHPDLPMLCIKLETLIRYNAITDFTPLAFRFWMLDNHASVDYRVTEI
jgi:hypothetical protein